MTTKEYCINNMQLNNIDSLEVLHKAMEPYFTKTRFLFYVIEVEYHEINLEIKHLNDNNFELSFEQNGWFIKLMYLLVAAVLALANVFLSLSWIWVGIVYALLLLPLNTQLDKRFLKKNADRINEITHKLKLAEKDYMQKESQE